MKNYLNDVEEIEEKLTKKEDKIVQNLISFEIINLLQKYNNLLNRKTTQKANMPSENILLFLDTMFDVINSDGYLIEKRFENFVENPKKNTKRIYKSLENVSHEWLDIYKRYNFLITLYKKNETRKLFINVLLKEINNNLKDKTSQDNFVKEFEQIPKAIIDNAQIQATLKNFY